MNDKQISRRRFIRKTTSLGVTAGIGAIIPSTAKSYSRIVNANERVNMGIIGCGGMANAHMDALLAMKESDNIEIAKYVIFIQKDSMLLKKKQEERPLKITWTYLMIRILIAYLSLHPSIGPIG